MHYKLIRYKWPYSVCLWFIKTRKVLKMRYLRIVHEVK